ncbi:hypothetical protein CAF53_16545 [Sphingobium sp. LB126]|uniref:DUF4337 domain-containing protein n=1 Tax=Sphingobium sp. LB126 TaxID=1983755 RepID=UPI000C205AC2|nr:DUF4337 domain-containing protein [Sphingobium sp. LB126]PJG45866.1 hypothetical protein CAF53_16545 [Sphingobium sp. LB126]
MEIEVSAQAKDKRINRMVAITVVILSVFTGVCTIKDGNIVQAMDQAQSNSVDAWSQYQATRTKLHLAQDTETMLGVMTAGPSAIRARTALARLDGEIAKYQAEAPGLEREARRYRQDYDALNIHDDQFDASDALVATAISLAAVAALCESMGLLFASWAFGAAGLFMGVCGFAGWGFHPDLLSHFLG